MDPAGPMAQHLRNRRFRAVLAMTLLSLAAFAVLAVAVERGRLDGIDGAVLTAMRDEANPADPWGPPWFEDTVAEITAIGGYPVIVIATVIAVVVMSLLSLHSAAFLAFCAIVSGSVASTGLKMAFARGRPDLVDHLDRTFTVSFPSGHAMISMLAWMTLAAIASRHIPRRGVRNFLLWSAFLLTIVIGLSRIYLGVHWPSDVIAGWAIGLAWAGAAWLVAQCRVGKGDQYVQR